MGYLLNRYKPVALFLQLPDNLRQSLNNVLPWISNLNISPVVEQNDVLMLFPLQSSSDNLFNNKLGRSTLVIILRTNIPSHHDVSHVFQLLIHAMCLAVKWRPSIAG